MASRKIWFTVIRVVMGYFFLTSGWEKFKNPEFASNLGATLAKFASQNPHIWYKNMILNSFIPNAGTFASLVTYGEILAGASLILGLLVPLGALAAVILNLNFFFASGWTSPSAYTLNLLMAVVGLALLFTKSGGYCGLDKVLFKKSRGLRKLFISTD